MNSDHLNVEGAEIGKQKLVCCAECGWPGAGKMPAGVRTLSENGARELIGQLSYFEISTELCSVCQEMVAAVQSRPWFVEAHGEYLDQIAVKKQLLAGR